MKRYLPLITLLCTPSLYAGELKGDYIQPANQRMCNPSTLLPSNTGKWVLHIALPRHCSNVGSLNPAFVWTKPEDIAAKANGVFTLTNLAGGVIYTVSTAETRLILPKNLEKYDGTNKTAYKWTISYAHWDGNTYTSSPREFTVSEYSIPTPEQISAAARSRAHPRAVKAIEDYKNIIPKLSVELTAALKETRRVADLLKAASPNDENKIFVPTENDNPSTLAKGAISERWAIEVLGQLYFILKTTEPAAAEEYLKACKTRLISLSQWPDSITSPTHQSKNDQANREAYLGLALGWDIFQAVDNASLMLTPEQMSAIRKMAMERINNSIEKAGDIAGFDNLSYKPYNSHTMTASRYITEALMYLVRDEDFQKSASEPTNAHNRLLQSWLILITSAGTWGGTSDGGFGNGSNYAWYNNGTNSRMLAAVKLITPYDLTEYAPIGKMGMNLIAQTPPAEPTYSENLANIRYQMGTFGDGTEVNDQFLNYASNEFRLLAYATKLPAYEWYWRTQVYFTEHGKPLTPYNFLLMSSGDVPAPLMEKTNVPTIPELQDSYLFEDAGYVAFHSKTTDSNRSSLFFRSSPLGTASHAQADNNAFAFVSNGEEMLISSGFYKNDDDINFTTWAQHTRSKNALTVTMPNGASSEKPGVGQAQETVNGLLTNTMIHSEDVSGKLVNYHAGNSADQWRIATGDATNAYRTYTTSTKTWSPILTKALRTVAYRKDDATNKGTVIIYDYATSDLAKHWELNFHTLSAPTTDKADRFEITGVKNSLIKTCVQYYGPAAFKRSPDKNLPDSIPDAPTEYTYSKPQYHIRWTTTSDPAGAGKEFRAVTVITEGGCSAIKATVDDFTQEKSKMTVRIGTAWITFDKENVKFSD